MSRPPLRKWLGICKKIPVSDTKQMLGLRIGFFSCHLTADNLFPVNLRAIMGPPKLGLLLEAKIAPALIIKPRFILVAHMDDFGFLIMSNQQQQMLIQNHNMTVCRLNVPVSIQGRCCIALRTVFQLTLCLRKTFLLIHKFRTAWAIELTADIDEWSNARATLDKQSCVIKSTLFGMNFTCMRWCDLNFSCLSTSITSAEVSSCQNKRRYPNSIWPTVFTFCIFKLSFCEFMTMVSLHVHKST